jgi:hypothetical protein
MITVSIVSHGHSDMVERLVAQLLECPEVTRIIVTRNIPESTVFPLDDRVLVIDNPTPKGFGANHNAAFSHCQGDCYCVLNPDIRLSSNPFPVLFEALKSDSCGVVAPAVVGPEGAIEDSVRHFPTPSNLLAKLLGLGDGRYRFALGDRSFAADWVGGMFMLFRSDLFSRLGGFDEGFFLYYEDVDICARVWKAGSKVVACPAATAIHDAHRASHRNWQHMRWHLGSMARYFRKHLGRLPVCVSL